jgi:adenylosuccinate lyase
MRAWKEGLDFHELVLADKEISGRVPRKQIENAFNLSRQLKNVDKIFARVFGNKSKSGLKAAAPAKVAKTRKRAR